jgi:NADH pyrophosphatase NudC (nudix superfamily)
MKYCPECGSLLAMRRIDGVERMACISPPCRFVHWDNPVPVVAALVEYHGRIVLARNAKWTESVFGMVTGYLERGETPEAAVVREVKEEIGLDAVVREFFGCHTLIERNQLILPYWVVATGDLNTGAEIAEVRLLNRAELASWDFGRFKLTAALAKRWLGKADLTGEMQKT